MMNVPNILTAARIVLAPIFLVVYFLPVWVGVPAFGPAAASSGTGAAMGIAGVGPAPISVATIVVLWGLFILIEITDIVDGAWARSKNQITNLGKLLDPFADVMSRLTYFVCFTVTGIMPVWLLIIYLYRELGVTFLRMMFLQQGITMAARRGGKLKAMTYSVSGGIGLFILTIERVGVLPSAYAALHLVALCVFGLAAFFALLSLADYLVEYARVRRSARTR